MDAVLVMGQEILGEERFAKAALAGRLHCVDAQVDIALSDRDPREAMLTLVSVWDDLVTIGAESSNWYVAVWAKAASLQMQAAITEYDKYEAILKGVLQS